MRKYFFLFIFSTFALVFSPKANAQKIKVRKVKGNQAVVEFAGGTLNQGQVYELVQDEYSDGSSGLTSHRRYLGAISFSLSNTKADGSDSMTTTSLLGRGGWNFGHFELGPLLEYTSGTSGSSTITTMKGGGWADLNLSPNIPGEIFIFGGGASASIGQTETGGSSRGLMELVLGPFVKWFPSGSDFGLRIDASYFYQKLATSKGDVTVSGFVSSAGVQFYF